MIRSSIELQTVAAGVEELLPLPLVVLRWRLVSLNNVPMRVSFTADTVQDFGGVSSSPRQVWDSGWGRWTDGKLFWSSDESGARAQFEVWTESSDPLAPSTLSSFDEGFDLGFES